MKGYGRNMGTWPYMMHLFMLLFMHLFIDALVWNKEKILYINSVFEVKVININFWQIWNFDVKGTGWLGLQLIASFWRKLWEDSICEWPLS